MNPPNATQRLMRLLVADDDETIRKLLPLYLEGIQCELTVVADGQSALDALMSGNFDMAIIDIRMPVLDGIEVIRKFRAAPANAAIPAIALTADVTPQTLEKSLSAGFTACLTKPIRRAELLDAVMAMQQQMESMSEQQRGPPRDTVDVDKLMIEDIVAVYGGKAGARHIFTGFITSAESALYRMHQAILSQDRVMAAEIAHRLIGTSGSMGAISLSGSIERYERRLKEDPDGLSVQELVEIRGELGRYRASLIGMGLCLASVTNSDA